MKTLTISPLKNVRFPFIIGHLASRPDIQSRFKMRSNGVAHLKIITMPMPQRILTSRQREVLEWIGDGKTVADTAQILGLNKATVEKHLRLARESLGVDTTAQAVLKASFHNQMFTV